METEAESVAYVVAGLAGFDTSAYSIGYITEWSSVHAARVLHSAHQIAAILWEHIVGATPRPAYTNAPI